MEVIQSPIFLCLASLILVIFIFVRFKERRPTPTPTPAPNLPPGPWRLPFTGNIHNLLGALPHRALHRLALEYGPVMHLQLGEISTVVISTAEAAKQVLKTRDVNFASRPTISSSKIIAYGNKDIAFAPYGDYWRRLRKICVVELLSVKRVESFRFIREQVFFGMMKWVASNEGSPLNLSEKLYYSTYEVVSRSALGSVANEEASLLSVFTGIFELSAGFDIGNLFPSVGLFQMLSRSRHRLRKYHYELDSMLERIIQEHRIVNGMEDEKEKREYIVDILLKHQDEGSEFPLSTDSIKAVIVDLFLAGSETSSTTSIWAIAEMIRNPRIIEKAQREVRHFFDPKGYVDESELNQLKYLESVIKETLRLHPPAPLLLPRKCVRKCEVNGYEIPAEATVIVNAWAINNDPSYWNNPTCFHPERFLDSTIDYKGTSFEYIPFGAGRRMCPGITFGFANVQLPLAILLYYFDWTLPKGMKPEEMDMTEAFGGTAGKKKPLVIVPVLRRALPELDPIK